MYLGVLKPARECPVLHFLGLTHINILFQFKPVQFKPALEAKYVAVLNKIMLPCLFQSIFHHKPE